MIFRRVWLGMPLMCHLNKYLLLLLQMAPDFILSSFNLRLDVKLLFGNFVQKNNLHFRTVLQKGSKQLPNLNLILLKCTVLNQAAAAASVYRFENETTSLYSAIPYNC